MRTLIGNLLLEKHPWFAKAADCPGAVRTENGIEIDRDSECYKEVAGTRLSKPKTKQRGTAGTHLLAMNEKIGIPHCQRCVQTAAMMNMNGDEWCKANRTEIVAQMRKRAESIGTFKTLLAAARAAANGYLAFIDLADPIGSMFDEAVRRSEADLAAKASSARE